MRVYLIIDTCLVFSTPNASFNVCCKLISQSTVTNFVSMASIPAIPHPGSFVCCFVPSYRDHHLCVYLSDLSHDCVTLKDFEEDSASKRVCMSSMYLQVSLIGRIIKK